jgi:ribonucleoside-diphosphate reductase alpha chain
MSYKALADYTQYSKYALHDKEKKRRETWNEQVDRVFAMHEKKFGEKLDSFREDFEWSKEMVKKKRVLGSQRALQFGGEPILQKTAKMYNCTVSYVDRPRFFQECMYLLLCGCGTGFSVQTHHIDKLPDIQPRTKGEKLFVVPDSIEGWADAIGVLMQSYFTEGGYFNSYDYGELEDYSGYNVKFDFSQIRPEGAPISWGGKAPGPSSLIRSIEKIEALIDRRITEEGQNRLKPIDAYDIIMHASDAVISGGIRRSATICLFSPHDEEMLNAKTGSWFTDNPQRGRSNNSVLLIRDKTSKEDFANIMKSVKEFGEPGFVWSDDTEALYNPCVEIGMRAYTEDGRTGWQFCNLCEINGKKTDTRERFMESCKAAAIIGTLQAAYDTFDYLDSATNEIVQREALLGVSMTGMMDCPEINFDPEIQREGAQLILDINEKIAAAIGTNPCARATCVKPAGTTSCILGTASGVHPHHADMYFRRVQANKLEFPLQHFKKHNPLAVEESVWSANKTDEVITFLCEVPKGAKTKNQVGAVDLLNHVQLTQQNWVEAGTRHERCVAPWLRHNVSNTINVKPEEWDDVEGYIYENRKWFAGISLLPNSGDKDYPQAPMCTVYTPKQMVKEYGDGAMMASGLIVDGLKAFDNNLWAACDSVLGIGETPTESDKPEEPNLPAKNGYNNKEWAVKLSEYAQEVSEYHDTLELWNKTNLKIDWIRRVKQFADRYCDGDVRRCTYLMKDVHNWKLWCDLKREYVDIDWSNVVEEAYELDVSTIGADGCAGNKCEFGDLGRAIEEKQNETKKFENPTDTEPTSAA